MSITATKEIRWSSAVRCPRAAVLEALNFDARPHTEQENLLFRMGKIAEHAIYLQYKHQFGDDDLVRHKAIRWPGGDLHGDVFVKSMRLPVEVKSHNNLDFGEAELLQLAGQMHYDHEAGHVGVLHIVDRSQGAQDPVTFTLTDDWVERVESLATVVTRGVQTRADDLPPCVCSKPSGCRGMGCRFTDAAWEGWTPPPAPVLDDPTIRQHVATLHQLKRKEREAKGTLAAIEEGRKQVEAVLADADLPYGHSDAGDYRIRRTLNRRETVSLKKLRAAALVPEDALADVVSVSTYDTWAVDLVGTAAPASAEDYGEVPF